jgi:hypothetical protein
MMISDGANDSSTTYGSFNVVRNTANGTNISFIRQSAYVIGIGFTVVSGSLTNNFGIYSVNTSLVQSTPMILISGTNVVINRNTVNNTGYALDVNGSMFVTNNLRVANNVALPCIIRNTTSSQSITANTNTIVTFPTLVSSVGSLGLTYSNGTFTNTSGMTITLNINAFIEWNNPGTNATASANAWLQHSALGALFKNTVFNTNVIITTNVAGSIILLNGQTFNIQVNQSNVANSLFYSVNGYPVLIQGIYITIR